jgi:DNA (cytosine-5)-methyltransferase 1
MPEDTWMRTDLSGNKDRQVGKSAKIRQEIELLRTPVASEAEGGAVAPDVAKANGQTLRLSGQMIDMVAPDQLPKLLPTPNTMEHREIKTPEQIAALKAKSPGGYRNLRETVVNELFPTPTTRDYKDGSQPHERDGKVQTDTVARAVFNSGEVLLGTPRATAANSSSKQVELGAPKSRLEDQVHTDWGKFEPAIRRWEAIIGRPAPEPTKPDGKEGNHRLSSKFTEWMMGLPDGWITDIGLKRNDELKACGNGVVPQQAELALRLLLELPEER